MRADGLVGVAIIGIHGSQLHIRMAAVRNLFDGEFEAIDRRVAHRKAVIVGSAAVRMELEITEIDPQLLVRVNGLTWAMPALSLSLLILPVDRREQ